jgi:hypothetical protein
MKKFVPICLALVTASGSAMAIDTSAANADLSNGIQTPIGDIASMREALNGGYGARAITPGDTYGGILVGQSPAGAAFVTNAAGRVSTHAYDLAGTAHGTLIGSGATVGFSEAQLLLSPNTLRVIVQCFTTDSSNLWVNGINIGGQLMNQGRLDVGAGATINGLLWNNIPGAITSVSIFNAVFIDGGLVATSSALTNGRTLPESGSVVVWNGVVGSGVDESWMVFDISFVPAPGAMALVGMGGLLAARRRR